MMQYNDLSPKLEAIVDSATLFDVVEVLVGICHGKAEHLRSDWQDERSARTWERAAKTLDRITANDAIRAV